MNLANVHNRGPSESNGWFRGFDGIRAIAILVVMLWHTAIVTRFPGSAMGLLRPLVMTGWAGVDLFFALSGFLITSLLLREELRNSSLTGNRRFSLVGFYMRRSLRILPIFVVAFVLQTFVLSGHLGSLHGDRVLASNSPYGLWPYATFWGNYFSVWESVRMTGRVVQPGLSYQAFWSLCVEEHFYLLWPLLLTFVRKGVRRIWVALAVCLVMCLARFFARTEDWQSHEAIHVLSHYRMDSILWGAIGALVVEQLPAMASSKFNRPRRIALLLIAGLIATLIAVGGLTVLPPPSPLGSSLGLSLFAIWTTLLLLELVAAPQSWLVRVLEFRPLAVVGRLSYGMYLIHFQAIDLGSLLFFSSPRGPSVANLLLGYFLFVIIAVAAATVLHVTIERPFLCLKARLISG